MRATTLASPRLSTCLATWFGCGLSPRAPGTVGSLGAVPLHLLLAQAPAGVHLAAVLLVSSELDELLAVADRLVVMYRGRISATLDPADASRATLGLLIAGGAPPGDVG